ncbi:MAG: HK97 family phage prohead protease [bacterium]
MDTKRFAGVDLKAGDKGEFSAVISTFDVVDKDGDVTVPGAFTDGAELVVSAYGHRSWMGELPVGKGRIRTTDAEAVVDGQFFMNTTAGRDTFEAVKQLGPLGEWSYGYDVLDSEPAERDGQRVRLLKRLAVTEASPVLVGAGVNTRTLATKAAKEAATVDVVEYKAGIRPHTTGTTTRAWDASAVVSAIPGDASVSDLRSVYAWVASDGDPEAKSSYRFPHHHGVGGPANIRALVAGVAALNGARGGTNIPEGDRRAVYNHLAGHLRDADREPPELRSADGGRQKNIDRLPGLLDELAEVVDDIREVGASRATKGKKLSSLTFEALGWAEEDLARIAAEVKRILASPSEAAANEYVRFLAQRHRAAG